jgi:hypothetical protein
VARIKSITGKESSVTRFLWECYIKPVCKRVLSLLVIAMCFSVLLAEIGLMAGENSSVAILSRGGSAARLGCPLCPPCRAADGHLALCLPLLLFLSAAHDPAVNPGGLVVLNLFYLGFISWVIIFALSQLRVSDLMEIVPGQKTTPRSMSFNARCAEGEAL